MHNIDDAVAADLHYYRKNLGKASPLGKTALPSIQVTGSCVTFLVVSIIYSPGQMPAVPKSSDLCHTPIDEQLNAGDETAVV